MLYKLAYVPEVDAFGFSRVIPFIHSGVGLEKYAGKLPDGVQRYVERNFTPKDGQLGLLVTAMGASEYYGPNSNSDWFDRKSLYHIPPGWADDPERDKVLSKGWPYGFPTFYQAHTFAHHQNRDPNRAIGMIDYVTWDPNMQWVLAVVLVDIDNAKKFDGGWVLDRISQGRSVPWSMGCRVPFDLSSMSADMDRYLKVWDDYDPTKHKSPADALLAEHARKPIAGLSRTRKDYPDELLYHMNEILSDGRKVYAINDFPKFFDLSAVGVPADQVAWSIMKLGSAASQTTKCKIAGVRCTGDCKHGSCAHMTKSSAALWEDVMTKVAAGKTGSVGKAADIDKEVTSPVSASSKLTKGDATDKEEKETDLPRELLNSMVRGKGLFRALSTPSMMGMILRPNEFRRMMLVHVGKKDMADKLDDMGIDLPPTLDEGRDLPFGPEGFDDDLSQMLMPMLGRRSCLGPVVHRTKVIIIRMKPVDEKDKSKLSGEEKETQEKISSYYVGYRRALKEKIASVRGVFAPRPWLREALYGLDTLDKTGMVIGRLSPLITEKTLEHVQAI